MTEPKVTAVTSDSRSMAYEQDGLPRVSSYAFFRGEGAHFHPSDRSLERPDFALEYLLKGLVPAAPVLDKSSRIVPFGSCFAAHIRNHLVARGYDLEARDSEAAYVTRMAEGMVHSYAVRQQFEWAWRGKVPSIELWHTRDGAVAYQDSIRARTARLFNAADAFIITLGLSEVWYDEPTGEVFWRAVPANRYDPARHKFRLTTVEENLANLEEIRRLIRRKRPEAVIVFTLSPIPLQATFREVPCVVASSVSKAILRVAVDQMISRHPDDARLFYYPSYEVVLTAFQRPFMEDRRHVHRHVLDFNMRLFERWFCDSGLTDEDVAAAFAEARALDDRVAREGHWSVPRTSQRERDTAPPGVELSPAPWSREP